jgi:hypothetical protein
VKQQQEAMRQTIRSSAFSSTAGFNFPAGSTAARAAAGPAYSSSGGGSAAADSSPAHLRPLSGVSIPASTIYAHSSGSATGALKGVLAAGKLASAVVASVDDWYASRADANMPDGSFNPSLTLQQSAEYEAARQAAELEGRISRGLVRTPAAAVWVYIETAQHAKQVSSLGVAAAPKACFCLQQRSAGCGYKAQRHHTVGSLPSLSLRRLQHALSRSLFSPAMKVQLSAPFDVCVSAASMVQAYIRLVLLPPLLIFVQMLVLHNGQPFNNITKPAPGMQPASPSGSTAAAGTAGGMPGQGLSPVQYHGFGGNSAEQLSPGRLTGTQQQQTARTAGSPQLRQLPEQHWQHNKHSGTFFSKYLKRSF